MSAFTARYAGYCWSCESRIHEGDTVIYREDVLVHETCKPATDALTLMRPVCDRCFLEPSATGLCGCD